MYKYFIFQFIYFDEFLDKGLDDVSFMNEIFYYFYVKYFCYQIMRGLKIFWCFYEKYVCLFFEGEGV